MFFLIPFLFILICVSSIFVPGLRTLAKCLLTTVFLIVCGWWALIEIIVK